VINSSYTCPPNAYFSPCTQVFRAMTKAPLRVALMFTLLAIAHPAFAQAWLPYNYAPSSRTVSPDAVFLTEGSVTNPSNVLSGQPTTISGYNSYIVLDFGKEVGGYVSLTFSASSDTAQSAGIAFSESALNVGPSSDSSNGCYDCGDGALTAPVPGASTYTVQRPRLRGGFRYLTVFLRTSGWVELSGVSLDYSPDPDRVVPNNYPNYFYSNDTTLNKVWYAGAYTVQTVLDRYNEGRASPPVNYLWNNGARIGEHGDVVLTDGAKRDRTVWPGDMGISLPTEYVALFDTTAARNSLQVLYNHQTPAGQLPYAGPPMNGIYGTSDTYHMWSLLGTYLYYLYSGDKAWLDSVWSKYKLGIAFSIGEIDSNGLLNVVNANDWGRNDQGGENIEANAILYGVLSGAVYLAEVEGDSVSANSWMTQAAALKIRINQVLWDKHVGVYIDNPSPTLDPPLYPEDGNALAVWFGVVDSPAKAGSISYVLNGNWNNIGSRSPELYPTIMPFPGSMEVMSHFQAGYDKRALDLIRQEWGYMLTAPQGTNSTFWERLNSDGSFDSFTSLAHGWSTGPTSALTYYVLGLQPDTVTGGTYHVIPHPGDLTHAEGDLTLSPGNLIQTSFDADASCRTFSMQVDAANNTGSTGTIGVPRFGANHTILINGATAWNGSSFVGSAGIAGAKQDENYIYFLGVQPGVRTFSYSDGKSCPAAPEQWTFCTDEGGMCTFSRPQRVRFGAQGKYHYGIFSGPTPCDDSAFGDPDPGVYKSCAHSSELYTICAKEGQTCSFSGTEEVRYGLNGQWATKITTGPVACTDHTFGDPFPDVVKQCEYRSLE